MNIIKVLIVFFLFIGLMIVPSSYATVVYEFQPDPANLFNLNHPYYYTWGINWNLPTDQTITSVTLTYKDIWNWTYAEPNNFLYTHFLDSASPGVSQVLDGMADGDDFSGQGVLLGVWTDPYGGDHRNFDLVYNIDVATFISFLSDGNFGFGIDPDCHYVNSDITLRIATVPEPTPLLLLGSGLVGLGIFGMKRFKNSKL